MVSRISLALLLCLLLCLETSTCFEYEVGGDYGWAVPKDNQLYYNLWASKNRFLVHDTIRFKYKRDSILVVGSEEEYEKCVSSHPVFFANDGDTLFKLDRPGLFFFISGVAGHCGRGQKMIIKVLETEAPPPPSTNSSSLPPIKNGAAEIVVSTCPFFNLLLLMLFSSSVLLVLV